MVKKILLVLTWFPMAIIFQFLLIVNLVKFAEYEMGKEYNIESLYTLNSKTKKTRIEIVNKLENQNPAGKIITGVVVAGDARPIILKNYLTSHNSPLLNYSDKLVESSDKFNLDYRLTTAISGCESTFGKHIPLKAGFNAWGVAVFTGTQEGAEFDSWDHGIDYVSKLIKERYKDKGHMDSLIKMGSIWAPPSVEKDNSWAKCVQFFMDEIQTF